MKLLWIIITLSAANAFRANEAIKYGNDYPVSHNEVHPATRIEVRVS